MKKTVAFTRNAANVFFHILTDCNLRCKHCYINPKEHGRKTLSREAIETWLELFAAKNKKSNVIFLGGEPTLHPDLPSAVKKAKTLGYTSITIDTNGYLFNDILTKVEPVEVDYFSFSLDGATRRMNDMIRGAGSYQKCLSGIRAAVARGFSVSLIFTASRANIDELEMMGPLLQNLGVDRFFIQVIGLRGKSAGRSDETAQVSHLKWIDVVPAVAERVAQTGITVTYPKVFLNSCETFECAGRTAENYFIFPNGRVYRCPLCEDFPIHSLELAENRLKETGKINERDLFALDIPEGCVMNKLIQPDNIRYRADGTPERRIACCMLKEEIRI